MRNKDHVSKPVLFLTILLLVLGAAFVFMGVLNQSKPTESQAGLAGDAQCFAKTKNLFSYCDYNFQRKGSVCSKAGYVSSGYNCGNFLTTTKCCVPTSNKSAKPATGSNTGKGSSVSANGKNCRDFKGANWYLTSSYSSCGDLANKYSNPGSGYIAKFVQINNPADQQYWPNRICCQNVPGTEYDPNAGTCNSNGGKLYSGYASCADWAKDALSADSDYHAVAVPYNGTGTCCKLIHN